MTALSDYERLECTGLWRPTPEDHRREVVISLGATTLVLRDTAERPLAHWSLPAIRRQNMGDTPAIYSPDPMGDETLEIDDATMTDAIERVLKTIDRRRAQPGRLRLLLTTGVLALFCAVLVFWLPGAMVDYASRISPPAQRTAIGKDLFQQIRRVSGHTCAHPQASAALAKLAKRIELDPQKLAVVRTGVETSTNFPGGYIVLNRHLVEDFEDPNVVVGYVLAEMERATQSDPLHSLLSDLGVRGTARFLTSGEISTPALTRYAEKLLAQPTAPVREAPLLQRFEQAGIPSSPYAYAIDISGETTISLIEADPLAQQESAPVLSDGEWVALQEICQD